MVSLSPQLSKIILAFLLLTPWFSLYQKILFPHFAQTGFDGAVITLVELVFVIFISIFGKHPRVTKQGAYLLLAICGWHISGFLSAYLSEHFYPSLIKQIEYLIHCMFAYSIWVFLSQTQKQEKMAWFLVFTFVWVIYYIFCAWYIADDPYSIDWVTQLPFFNNIRHSGFILICFLPFLFLPLLYNLKNKTLITIALLSLYWGFLIWTCSRGTYFASLISIAAIYYFYKSTPKIAFIITSSFLIGWIIALQFPSISESLNPFRLWFLNFQHTDVIEANSLSSGRLDIWFKAFEAGINHNVLFGFGPNGYTYVSPTILTNTVHPHSSLFQLISEYGFVGFALLILLFINTLNIWNKNQPVQNKNTVIILSRVSVLSFIIGSTVDGHFYYNFSLIYLGIIFSLSFTAANQIKPNKYIPLSLLVSCLVSIFFLKQHWATYTEQQVELIDPQQLIQVEDFPSYYFPMKWLYGDKVIPELREKAVKLGQKHGPMKCNYFLTEYIDSKDTLHLTKDIETHCRREDLKNFNIKDFHGSIK